MPVWDVNVTWEFGRKERELQVTAPTKKAATAKAEEFLSYNHQRPVETMKGRIEVVLAEEKYQRRKTIYPRITDLSSKKTVKFKKKISRTNEPGTCLWCGNKLKRAPHRPDALGPYADNSFCSMQCGYEFGITAVVLHFRLEPRSDI
jgi:hypothetical protein